MMRLLRLVVVGALALSSGARAQEVTSINSAGIVAATTAAAGDLSCLDFRINGVCLFLICTPIGCSVETSIQFRHFNPSLVVTSYDALDQSPWTELAVTRF